MSTQTYLVEMEYRDINTIRDSLDLAHGHLMLTRTLMRALGQPVRKGAGPLRTRINTLIKDFPRFVRYDPDPCFGIHNFVDDDDPLREVAESLVSGGYVDVVPSLAYLIDKAEEALKGSEPTAHCTECGAERLNIVRAVA